MILINLFNDEDIFILRDKLSHLSKYALDFLCKVLTLRYGSHFMTYLKYNQTIYTQLKCTYYNIFFICFMN